MHFEQLSRAERVQLAELWALRAHNELHTSRTFEQVHAAALLLQAPATITDLSHSAAADERRHHDACVRLAARYDATRASAVREPKLPELHFKNCTEREHALLLIAAHCCLSETIAVGYLVTCRAECEDEDVRQVLHDLSRDEIRHARIGWATLALPSVQASERQTLSQALPELFRATRRGWLEDWDRLSKGLALGHGFLDAPTLTRVVDEALDQVVTPGLREVHISAARSR
jgi:hypothetical protein